MHYVISGVYYEFNFSINAGCWDGAYLVCCADIGFGNLSAIRDC